MTGQELLFWLFALATCFGAIAVVISQNVVRMAFYLILSLGSASGLFFLLGADLVGAAQLLVYVGGTLVLLVFGVMLTASGPYVALKTSPGEGLLAGIIGVALLALLLSSAGNADWGRAAELAAAQRGKPEAGYSPASAGSTARPIGTALIGLRVEDVGAAEPRRPGYLLPFEIASVHLLVVLVGAAYLARAKRRVPREN